MRPYQQWCCPTQTTAWREFVNDYPANLAVSFAYNFQKKNSGAVRPEKVHRDLDRYHLYFETELLGSSVTKWCAADRSSFIGFIENANSNTHAHISLRLSQGIGESKFLEIAERLWKLKFHASGTVAIKPIRDSGWAQYITENIGDIIDRPELFVASRLINPRS